MKYITTDKHPDIKEGVIFRKSEGRPDMYVSEKNTITYITEFDLEVLIEKGYIQIFEILYKTKEIYQLKVSLFDCG